MKSGAIFCGFLAACGIFAIVFTGSLGALLFFLIYWCVFFDMVRFEVARQQALLDSSQSSSTAQRDNTK